MRSRSRPNFGTIQLSVNERSCWNYLATREMAKYRNSRLYKLFDLCANVVSEKQLYRLLVRARSLAGASSADAW